MTKEKLILLRIKVMSPTLQHEAPILMKPDPVHNRLSVLRRFKAETKPTFYQNKYLRSVAQHWAPKVFYPTVDVLRRHRPVAKLAHQHTRDKKGVYLLEMGTFNAFLILNAFFMDRIKCRWNILSRHTKWRVLI
jgi:hypothetical protein